MIVETDVFQTRAWFANLLAVGFMEPPGHLALWWPPQERQLCLHLMREQNGKGLASLSNYYSCLYGPEGFAQDLHEPDWRLLCGAIGSLPDSFVIRLQPLDVTSSWLGALERGLRETGYWTDRFFCFGNWYQPVPLGGFQAYWPQRPSALRHSVERGRRRLDRSGRWSIHITRGDADDLDAAIGAYEQVYAQSWKQPEPCPGFIPGLIRTAAREGWLRLGVLWFNGQPLAAQLWLVHAGKANIYKLAYVQGFEKFSAGSVLTAALMQHVMDIDRVEEVDYLSGDDAYKADWMAMRRERVGLLACNMRHWRGWWAAGRQVLGHWRRSFQLNLASRS